jgi:hypothetical protein
MKLWHDIVGGYNDSIESKGPRTKDHGTFSEKITVILLMYLAFGADYSTNIAKFFTELAEREQFERGFSRVLTQPNKISSVLKRMNDDKLVILSKKASFRAGKRSYYALNPQIIQSPASDEIYLGSGGSPLSIPLEIIEDFLRWMDTSQTGKLDMMPDEELRQKRHESADEILRELIISSAADYFRFLTFFGIKARKWVSMGLCDHQPTLSALIKWYINELDPIARTIRIREIDSWKMWKCNY